MGCVRLRLLTSRLYLIMLCLTPQFPAPLKLLGASMLLSLLVLNLSGACHCLNLFVPPIYGLYCTGTSVPALSAQGLACSTCQLSPQSLQETLCFISIEPDRFLPSPRFLISLRLQRSEHKTQGLRVASAHNIILSTFLAT